MPTLTPLTTRHVAHVAVLVMLAAGCASVAPEPPVGQPEAVAQTPTPPAVTPVASAPPRSTAPARAAPRVTPPAATAKPALPAATAPRPPAAPTLDLTALKDRLKSTKAIGVFTKIALKNQVDDLLDHFRDYYGGKPTLTMMEMRRSYDLLMMKVLSLLQDEDRMLASAVVSSREAIWGLLADPKKFATLDI